MDRSVQPSCAFEVKGGLLEYLLEEPTSVKAEGVPLRDHIIRESLQPTSQHRHSPHDHFSLLGDGHGHVAFSGRVQDADEFGRSVLAR